MEDGEHMLQEFLRTSGGLCYRRSYGTLGTSVTGSLKKYWLLPLQEVLRNIGCFPYRRS